MQVGPSEPLSQIHGRLCDAQGKPQASTVITLVTELSKKIAETKTDSRGGFTFKAILMPGTNSYVIQTGQAKVSVSFAEKPVIDLGVISTPPEKSCSINRLAIPSRSTQSLSPGDPFYLSGGVYGGDGFSFSPTEESTK